MTRHKAHNHWHEGLPLTEAELENSRSFIQTTPKS